MYRMISLSVVLLILGIVQSGEALYEDSRCRCVCPDPTVVNGTEAFRKLYIGTVASEDCNCEIVVFNLIKEHIKGKIKEFCPRCNCKYETRNTTTIRVVVIIVIWIISLLIIYMLFLMCLDPLFNKRTTTYQEHRDDSGSEVEVYNASTTQSGNVLNRVGHQQFKWKRQVQEQRRNIYDRHAMLN